MIFKLIRTDTAEPHKIQLSIGKHILGRGAFLECVDKRVSRTHLQLEVTVDTVNITALHQNPCFFIRKGMQDIQYLTQNCSATLSNGDKFGLLPSEYWYEVLVCNLVAEGDTPRNNVTLDQSTLDISDRASINNDNGNVDDSNNTQTYNNVDDGAIQFPSIENQEDIQKPPLSPSVLDTNYDIPVVSDISGNTTENNCEQNNSVKRRHSSVDDENNVVPNKIIKIETIESNEPSTSSKNDQMDTNDAPNANVKNEPPASPTSTNNPSVSLRERCMYGARCYRRNPQHKAQFSHPSDSDWGSGDRGVCPWGAGCLKADPRHWRDHTHPEGTQPPDFNQPRPGMRVVERHGNIFYINANTVNFYDDHINVESSDGDSADYDYEF